MFVNENIKSVKTHPKNIKSLVKSKNKRTKKKIVKKKILNCTIPIKAGNDTWNKILSSTLSLLFELSEGEQRFRIHRYQFSKMIGCCESSVSRRLKELHELGYIVRENVRSRINGEFLCELFVTVDIEKIKETKEGSLYLEKYIKRIEKNRLSREKRIKEKAEQASVMGV